MNDLVITAVETDGVPLLAAAYYKENVLSLLTVRRTDETPADSLVPGEIRIGVVEALQKNIGSAFVRVGDTICFLEGKKVRPGQEIAVQVVKAARGSKQPCVRASLEIAGRYCVVTVPDTEKVRTVLSRAKSGEEPADPDTEGSIELSKKLTPQQRETLGGWKKDIDPKGMQIMLRTNAGHADKHAVLAEVNGIIGQMAEICLREKTRTCHSVLYRPLPFYAEMLSMIRGEAPDRIISDLPEVIEAIRQGAETEPYRFPAGIGEMVQFYQDDSLPLTALYNMKRDIGRLLAKQVYLKSGAYLVIEQTEAFVSIDVNTGKCIKGKIPEETYRAINKEAALEAARQLRLRNLSGMILIDFINMKEEEHKEELLHVMKNAVREDPLPVTVVDMTKLGIMEITRPRKERSVSDLIRGTKTHGESAKND